MRLNYCSYVDDITGNKIYAVVDHEWNTLDRYILRIFAEKRPEYRGSNKKILRYFPQIDDNKEENIYEVGPREGFKYLADAKKALENKIANLKIQLVT